MAVFFVAMSVFALYITQRMGKSFSTQKRRAERVIKKSISDVLLDGIDCCKTLEIARAELDTHAPLDTLECKNPGVNQVMNPSAAFINTAREGATGRWYRSLDGLYENGDSILEFTASELDDVFPGYYLNSENLSGGETPIGMNADLRCVEVDNLDGSPLFDGSGERVKALMLNTYTKQSNLERAIDQTIPKVFREPDAVAACWPVLKCGWTAKCGNGNSYTGDKTKLRDLRDNPDYVLNPCFAGDLRLFITKEKTDGQITHPGYGSGALVGIEAADAICNDEAEDATSPGNGGVWQAVLSVDGNPAKNRINIAAGVNNLNGGPDGAGQAIATDYGDFWTGGMHAPIAYEADGTVVSSTGVDNLEVWTGSGGPNPTAISASTCASWTITTGLNVGKGRHTGGGASAWWSDDLGDCNEVRRFYCLGYFE